MNQTLLTAGLVALVAAPASANPFAGLLQFTSQIRGQSALVEAQAAATFDHLPRGRILADDVYDELEDICRELDRLEADLGRRHVSRGLIRRLERRAQELDEEACELSEAVEEAIRDASRRSRLRASRPYPVPHLPTNVALAHTLSRSRTMTFGGGRLQISIGAPTAFHPATSRVHVGRHVPHVRPIGPGVQESCLPPVAARALRVETERLRLMTKQLLAVLCN